MENKRNSKSLKDIQGSLNVNTKILNDNQQLLSLNKNVSQQLNTVENSNRKVNQESLQLNVLQKQEMKKSFNDMQESLQLDHNLIKEKKTDKISKVDQENLQSGKEEKNVKNLNTNQVLSLNKTVSQQLEKDKEMTQETQYLILKRKLKKRK
jgi:hypothetical protein